MSSPWYFGNFSLPHKCTNVPSTHSLNASASLPFIYKVTIIFGIGNNKFILKNELVRNYDE